MDRRTYQPLTYRSTFPLPSSGAGIFRVDFPEDDFRQPEIFSGIFVEVFPADIGIPAENAKLIPQLQVFEGLKEVAHGCQPVLDVNLQRQLAHVTQHPRFDPNRHGLEFRAFHVELHEGDLRSRMAVGRQDRV